MIQKLNSTTESKKNVLTLEVSPQLASCFVVRFSEAVDRLSNNSLATKKINLSTQKVQDQTATSGCSE